MLTYQCCMYTERWNSYSIMIHLCQFIHFKQRQVCNEVTCVQFLSHLHVSTETIVNGQCRRLAARNCNQNDMQKGQWNEYQFSEMKTTHCRRNTPLRLQDQTINFTTAIMVCNGLNHKSTAALFHLACIMKQ